MWPGAGFVGRSGREQVAAAYAVHGPRTALIIARPTSGSADPGAASTPPRLVVQEFLLDGNRWVLAKGDARIPAAKSVFAPANLRAAADNAAYAALVQRWMGERYTLRYSGGMVPDVHHILAKVSNPETATTPSHSRRCCTKGGARASRRTPRRLLLASPS